MFYACLATFLCVSIGMAGIIISLIDIQKFNFGLYLALLSVVGTTVSTAFWIINPSVCANPRWVQWLLHRYGDQLEPVGRYIRNQMTKHRRRFWDDEESVSIHPNRRVKMRNPGASTYRSEPSCMEKEASPSPPSVSAIDTHRISLVVDPPSNSFIRISIEPSECQSVSHNSTECLPPP